MFWNFVNFTLPTAVNISFYINPIKGAGPYTEQTYVEKKQ